VAFAFCLGAGVFTNSPCQAFESFEHVRAHTHPSEGLLLDRNHEILQEYRVDKGIRQLEWVSLQMISPVLKNAIVHSEDREFWDHHGVDWKALVKASVKNLFQSHPRGASTITMQLASILDRQLVPKKKRRDYLQKVKQIQSARELEKSWSKEQILEAYLNLVSFRGELRGITAASYGLFSKAPYGIDENEAFILAALIRSPGSAISDVEKRACHLGKQMKVGFQCDVLRETLNRDTLQARSIRPQMALAPHLVKRIRNASRAQVTLDRKLQEFVLKVLQRQILSIQNKNAHDAAALVVDNKTGEVLAYVGGVGQELSSAFYVDGVRAERQAGSSLKPFLYGLALDRKYLTAASFLDDSALDIPILGSVYRPKNYDNDYHGKNITVRIALASSLNIPAVKTINLVGVEAFVRQLKVLGFNSLREADYYGPSLALGAADITLWDLVNAYRTFANQGVWSELKLEKDEKNLLPNRKVFSPEAAYVISDILSDRESRSLTFGLENPLALRFWAAVKTGTSKDMRDNWCIGYSDRYTVGVWVGNFSGEPMWNVTGVTGAAPAWAEVMKGLHRGLTNHPPRVPKGLVLAQDSNRKEWYFRGTEPVSFSKGLSYPQDVTPLRTRITYPVDGMVIARDPDIPPESQRLFFDSNAPHQALKWILNGKEIQSSNHLVSWQPIVSGSYRLSVLDADGSLLDSVQFLVR